MLESVTDRIEVNMDIDAFMSDQKALNEEQRDALLKNVAALERSLGYGSRGKPTSKQLRDFYRKTGGYCPHCGKELCIVENKVSHMT